MPDLGEVYFSFYEESFEEKYSDIFPDEKPYSKHDAWLWIKQRAVNKPETVKRAGQNVDLLADQLCDSIGFIAQGWEWAKSTAYYYLKHLEKEGSITLHTTKKQPPITVITIMHQENKDD